MESREKLPACEEMIMSILWSADEDLDLMTVTAKAEERFGKIWKLQTVATFMTRLEKNKYISIYKVGRYSHYHPMVSLDEYRNAKLQEVTDLLFEGRQEKLVEFWMNSHSWIPLNELMPKIQSKVLLSLRDRDICTGFRAGTEGYFFVESGGFVESEYVLAWQPLPEPFKINEGEALNGKAD